MLKLAKYNVFITQVMWPPVVERFSQIADFFSKHDMHVRPKIFRGYYKWKEYPESYSQKERNAILDFMKVSGEDPQTDITAGHINPDLEKLWINGHVSFRGTPCLAGAKFVSIEFNGDIRRCKSDSTNLGNIYRGEFNLLENAVHCKANICSCPYYGFLFSSGKHTTVKNRIPVFIRQMLERDRRPKTLLSIISDWCGGNP